MTVTDAGSPSPANPGNPVPTALPAAQQPQWPDPDALRRVRETLSGAPPLTSAARSDRLRERLAAAARGEAFLLQGGDCAETFDGGGPEQLRGKLLTLLRMSAVLTFAGGLPVVKVGRLAGQYAKPRSEPTETRDGLTLPSYRGDAVNGPQFTALARTPDPERLLRMYRASAATMDLLRTWTADVGTPLSAGPGPEDSRAPGEEPAARDIDALIRVMRAGGADVSDFDDPEFFTSHEALLLDYEHALTRLDPAAGRPYGRSGHMLWIGERTRQLDGAHIDFAARIGNPVGVKLGPTATADETLALIDRIDPDREPGRLTLITRMGADRIRDLLPDLVEKVTAGGAHVVWVCDPMHGNTFRAPGGYKTRAYDAVLNEIRGFFEVHRALGTHPGGLHIEFTGADVTECVGGSGDLAFQDLPLRYETACDPRLNGGQALELAFAVARLLRG